MHDDQSSLPRGPRRVAIIGAGKAGTALARVMLDAGHTVTLTGSAGPEAVESIASILAPGSIPERLEQAVSASDFVVLALPLHRVSALGPRLFSGKVVVDAMNYWPPVNGTLSCLEETERGSSELIQEQLPGARIVKAFNHTGYHDLEPDRRPSGHPERLGIAIAADDHAAAKIVADVVESIGYDPVILDSLTSGRALAPGSPVFGARMRAEEIRRNIVRAPRDSDPGSNATGTELVP